MRRVTEGNKSVTSSLMAVETRTVHEDEGRMRIDRCSKAHSPTLPFGHLQKLLRSGQVRVDGGRVKTNTRLARGQRVRVPPLSKKPSPQQGEAAQSDGEGREDSG